MGASPGASPPAPASSAVLMVAAWACFALIGFLTLGPAHFRPHVFHSTGLDRAAGYAVLGLLLGIAYPRHLLLISVLVIGGAAVLEAMQFLRPDRDARLIDLLAKVAGGALGIAAATVVSRLMTLWRGRRRGGPEQG